MQRPALIAFASLLLAACLPEGEPGIGQSLLPERGLSGLRLTDRQPGLPAGVLYSHRVWNRNPIPIGEGDNFSLPYDLFFLPSGGSPVRLVEDYQTAGRWDAAQRLYVLRDRHYQGGSPGADFRVDAELWQVQLDGAAARSLGRVGSFDLSPGGTRLLYQPEHEQWVLADLQDHQLRFQAKDHPRFVGEDLFYAEGGTLFRVRDPAAGATTLLTGEGIGFFTVGSGAGNLLLVANSKDGEPHLLRMRAGADDPPELIDLPGKIGGVELSPDGARVGWLQRVDREHGRLHVIDLATNGETSGELPLPPPRMRPMGPMPPPPDGPNLPRELEPPSELEFRPGSDQLWCFLDRQVSILGGDGEVASYPQTSVRDRGVPRFMRGGFFDLTDADFLFYSEATYDPGSRFSPDGRLWTLSRAGGGHLGDADHPESEDTIPVLDAEDNDSRLLEVVPGRWVAFWRNPNFDEHDLSLLDLARRTTRVLGHNVVSAHLGRGRALIRDRTLTGNPDSPGDLFLVDLETGAETRLAGNVVDYAVAPACPDCDVTAPGAHLVYVVSARVPWRYDGLWEAMLP